MADAATNGKANGQGQGGVTKGHFKLDVDGDGIALITWDMPGRSMNLIDVAMMTELAGIVEKVASDAAIKGAVITSGKETFSGGADLTLLEGLGRTFAELAKSQGQEAAVAKLFEESRKLSQLYRRLETCGKPWAAAVNGTALGGGFELCLACHQRIAADNDKTRVGLPEVKIGLFPGAGGTQRVARMIPPADALQFLLKGDQLRLNRAKAMKLVDAVVPAADLVKTAKDWVKANPKAKAPWDDEKFRLPGGPVYSKAGMMTFPPANAIYRRETYDNYPAARAILQVVYEGLLLPIDRALTVESRYFAKILRTPEAAAMIRSLFVSMQDLNRGARRPANVPQVAIKKVGIIGAGFMGAGIASVSAQAGIDVVLIDRDQESADKGKAHIQKSLTDQVNKGRMTGAARDAVLARVTPTADYAALAGCDLVVEAVFEDRKVKADATTKAQAVVPDVVFGSNTSTLPITSLAETAKDAAKFIGIHFFSPVERMMLVEIIMGKKTGDQALATALDFVRAIRKTPIVVNDTRGFYANRCVLNYIQEGHLMLLEGIPAALIENAARMAGMPVGPLSLNDETALDLGLKIVRATEADLGAGAVDPGQKKLLEEMVEKRQRLGRKNGKGFYDYPPGEKKRLWPGLAELLPKQLSREQVEAIDVDEIKHRLLAVMAVEAARTFEEGVITDVREADVGSILGFGFAPYSGGTLSYIDMMGTKKFVELCERLEKKYGPRFKPGKLLVEMAKTDDRFYRRFAPGKKAA
jgi:3-hydroxyacyl-CoA dehydrogenase/enoyl-CoA hydratase/3-hydroxybutyryl-CoA epimerase